MFEQKSFVTVKTFVTVRSCFIGSETGARQCAHAVWSTFAEIDSTHPSALMHYL